MRFMKCKPQKASLHHLSLRHLSLCLNHHHHHPVMNINNCSVVHFHTVKNLWSGELTTAWMSVMAEGSTRQMTPSVTRRQRLYSEIITSPRNVPCHLHYVIWITYLLCRPLCLGGWLGLMSFPQRCLQQEVGHCSDWPSPQPLWVDVVVDLRLFVLQPFFYWLKLAGIHPVSTHLKTYKFKGIYVLI